MLRLIWFVLGSGHVRKPEAADKSSSKAGGSSRLSFRDAEPDSGDDDVATVAGSSTSISSLYEDQGTSSRPESPIIPPSPTLSRSGTEEDEPPPEIRRLWPRVAGLEALPEGAGVYEKSYLDELQEQDAELHESLVEFLAAFRGSSLRLCIRFMVRSSAAGSTAEQYVHVPPPVDLIVDVGPEGE